ncbi:DUF397 domain-containing protein [Yinghuangia soli]|uniref:DUF397 domain-containing protein n=1 Tax=Yinghuangia soli TaxID=2908204 RepID=A0AA41U5I4_9ACTN|nr:DUF397 domain-containing protein [Yinghuangia soli]MCF2531962.1 DUF397 domain-containing protein [Yinghuangia soli]
MNDGRDALKWRKSSYSSSQGGECVEVAGSSGRTIPVRDSKDATRGTVDVATAAWASFTNALKR